MINYRIINIFLLTVLMTNLSFAKDKDQDISNESIVSGVETTVNFTNLKSNAEVFESVNDLLNSIKADPHGLSGSQKSSFMHLKAQLGFLKGRDKDEALSKEENEALVKYDAKIKFVLSPRFLEVGLPEEITSKRVDNISVVFLDLDKFKSVNGTFGHPRTDVVLEKFSLQALEVIEKMSRVGEYYFGRHGGDEFYIVLLNTPMNRAIEIAEAVRKSTEQDKTLLQGIKRLPKEDIEGEEYLKDHLTMSTGLVHTDLPHRKMSVYEVQRLIAKIMIDVDAQAYKSKKLGRNRLSYAATCSMFFQ